MASGWNHTALRYRRTAAGGCLATAAVLALGLTACSSSTTHASSSSTTSASSASSPTTAPGPVVNLPALTASENAAMTSACQTIRSDYPGIGTSTLQVGLSAGTPGLAEVAPSDPHGYTGIDPALAEVIGQCLNRSVSFSNFAFSGMIPALTAGHVQMVVGSMYDTAAREKQVAYVDYIAVKESGLVPAGNPHNITTMDSLCGLTVAQAQGSVEVTLIQAQSDKCKTEGKQGINLLEYPQDDQTVQALLQGRAQFHLDGGTSIPDFIKAYPGKLENVMQPVPGPSEGIQFQLTDTNMIHAVEAIMTQLQNIGGEDTLLTHYGLSTDLQIPAVIKM